jgi:hypothetical protein
MRLSVVFFHGRWYLPIPYRHPISMVTGEIVEVQKKQNPSEEEIKAVLEKVKISVTKLYETLKPEWETRPLKIY